jgi:hypothetical protein
MVVLDPFVAIDAQAVQLSASHLRDGRMLCGFPRCGPFSVSASVWLLLDSPVSIAALYGLR